MYGMSAGFGHPNRISRLPIRALKNQNAWGAILTVHLANLVEQLTTVEAINHSMTLSSESGKSISNPSSQVVKLLAWVSSALVSSITL